MQNKQSYTNVVVGVIIVSFFVAIGFLGYSENKAKIELAKIKARCIENAIATNTGIDNCDKIAN